MLFLRKQEKTFVRLPLDVKGRLYVSPMPYGPYDPGNALFKVYLRNRIEFVVALTTDVEMAKKAKRDLFGLYKKNNIELIRFPIADYTSPDLEDFSRVVDQATGYLRAGAHMAIHCNAGVGRTGVVTCAVVRDIMDIGGDEAIAYVKEYMQTNMTDEQRRLVNRFQPLRDRISAQTD